MGPSKLSLNTLRSSESLKSAGEEHLPLIETDVNALCEDDTGTLVRQAIQQMLEHTVGAQEAAQQRDIQHATQVAGQGPVLAGRDALVDDVRGELVDARSSTLSTYGPEPVKYLGFDGPTPRTDHEVHQLADRFVAAAKTVQLPEPRRPELTYDLQVVAARIEEKNDRLGAQLELAAKERREAETTLEAKTAAFDKYEKLFRATADTLSTFLELTGHENLADRVRPSPRRPGLTTEVEEEVAAEPAAAEDVA